MAFGDGWNKSKARAEKDKAAGKKKLTPDQRRQQWQEIRKNSNAAFKVACKAAGINMDNLDGNGNPRGATHAEQQRALKIMIEAVGEKEAVKRVREANTRIKNTAKNIDRFAENEIDI